MHERQKHFYVGVDLHKQHHVAVIINCWQEKLTEQFSSITNGCYNLKELYKFDVQKFN